MSNLWVIQKETDFVKKKKLPWREIKKGWQEMPGKSLASKTHLQKVWTFSSMIEKFLDPKSKT